MYNCVSNKKQVWCCWVLQKISFFRWKAYLLEIELSQHHQTHQKTEGKVKSIRADNGGEYISNSFKIYPDNAGIQHQPTVAYTPQQNVIAESMNRKLMDLVRAMIQSSSFDRRFWAESLSTAVNVRNRVISRSSPKHTTPYQLWMQKPSNHSHLRVFDAKSWYFSCETVVPVQWFSTLCDLKHNAHMNLRAGLQSTSETTQSGDFPSAESVMPHAFSILIDIFSWSASEIFAHTFSAVEEEYSSPNLSETQK